MIIQGVRLRRFREVVRWSTGLLFAISIALPALAETRYSERFERRQVEPGETVSRDLACGRGDLTGGGYQLYGQPDDRSDFAVTGSYPLANGAWRVEVQNISGRVQPLAFRIYVLCSTGD